MISIISASNRNKNLTALFAKKCAEYIESKGEQTQLYFLDQLPDQLSLKSVYEHMDSVFSTISKELILPASKLLFVVPEYNGSIPGILKLFIDGMAPEVFIGKKAALIGLAAGRAGNLRGMDHLTDILHHLQVNVMPQKLPISKMYDLLDGVEVVDEDTLKDIERQVEKLIAY